MKLMKESSPLRPTRLALLASLSSLTLVTAAWGLVPGPILLSDDQLERLQQDDARQLKLSPTRAKTACLGIGEARLCPGVPLIQAQQMRDKLPSESRKHTLLFSEGEQLKGVLALLPGPIKLPPARLGEAPISLGPEPVSWKSLSSKWTELPSKQSFESSFGFKSGKVGLPVRELNVWYYGEQHLGLLTRRIKGEKGEEFVIGAFVVK